MSVLHNPAKSPSGLYFLVTAQRSPCVAFSQAREPWQVYLLPLWCAKGAVMQKSLFPKENSSQAVKEAGKYCIPEIQSLLFAPTCCYCSGAIARRLPTCPQNLNSANRQATSAKSRPSCSEKYGISEPVLAPLVTSEDCPFLKIRVAQRTFQASDSSSIMSCGRIVLPWILEASICNMAFALVSSTDSKLWRQVASRRHFVLPADTCSETYFSSWNIGISCQFYALHILLAILDRQLHKELPLLLLLLDYPQLPPGQFSRGGRDKSFNKFCTSFLWTVAV